MAPRRSLGLHNSPHRRSPEPEGSGLADRLFAFRHFENKKRNEERRREVQHRPSTTPQTTSEHSTYPHHASHLPPTEELPDAPGSFARCVRAVRGPGIGAAARSDASRNKRTAAPLCLSIKKKKKQKKRGGLGVIWGNFRSPGFWTSCCEDFMLKSVQLVSRAKTWVFLSVSFLPLASPWTAITTPNATVEIQGNDLKPLENPSRPR